MELGREGALGAASPLRGQPASKWEPQSYNYKASDAGATQTLEKEPKVQEGRQPRKTLGRGPGKPRLDP